MFFCVAFFSSPMLQKQPNAGPQAPLEAEATQERRLEAVACRPWFGVGGVMDAAPPSAAPPMLGVSNRGRN